ncbi:Uncharacterized protein Adt_10889 [Abeliophyllum distichum]|uniref:Uncharacterized protein n=1 Tax=Abeliophyllum distichum TaxID=126358 RepID=A0ABD1ULG5_9LAMI
MLTLLIPSPKAPDKDIDVFLQSLVDELKELWGDRIDTRDAGRVVISPGPAAGQRNLPQTCPYYSIVRGGASQNVAGRGSRVKLPSLIAKEVLGEQRGHVREIRRVPKGIFPSLDSTATSKAPQGTSHQFSRDPQNDDPRFAMYKAQIRRMQRKNELLKNSILGVVPGEDENEGLGDL